MIFRGKLCDSLILLSDPPSLQYLPSLLYPPLSPISFFPTFNSPSFSFPSLPTFPIPSPGTFLFHTFPFSSLPSSFLPFHSLHSPFSAFPYTFSFSAFSLPSISLLFKTTFPFPVSQIKKK